MTKQTISLSAARAIVTKQTISLSAARAIVSFNTNKSYHYLQNTHLRLHQTQLCHYLHHILLWLHHNETWWMWADCPPSKHDIPEQKGSTWESEHSSTSRDQRVRWTGHSAASRHTGSTAHWCVPPDDHWNTCTKQSECKYNAADLISNMLKYI